MSSILAYPSHQSDDKNQIGLPKNLFENKLNWLKVQKLLVYLSAILALIH
ncbi:MAG: hypothetical protein QNJ70_14685 [Xenococcaceae cyanobacterium MO_207.B15]|nr:hypothetical protein [Xenococcaceae cyanobacterium MO_207.B15]MDJ0747084.1 hypothetical protein [Xenococcaceae cyanobacterium MO_167.B27]